MKGSIGWLQGTTRRSRKKKVSEACNHQWNNKVWDDKCHRKLSSWTESVLMTSHYRLRPAPMLWSRVTTWTWKSETFGLNADKSTAIADFSMPTEKWSNSSFPQCASATGSLHTFDKIFTSDFVIVIWKIAVVSGGCWERTNSCLFRKCREFRAKSFLPNSLEE